MAETSSLRIMELQLAGSRCEQIMLLRLVCFGLCPCQHNGTYTRNVYPATPTKKPVKILHFAESKSEPLSRKNSGKAAQNRVRKGSSPLILPKPFLISFFPTSKIGRKKARKSFCLPLQGHKLSPPARERNCPLPHFFLLPYAGNGMISLSGGSSFGCFSSGCMALSTVPMSR